MFKNTERQRTFFEVGERLGESVNRRLKDSWAGGFQARVLPILLDVEDDFAALYSDGTGRPNWSVARLLGLSVLQEMLSFDDQTALDSLSFDVRWQHALGMEPEDAYLSRRSLVDFRSRLVAKDPEMKSLRRVFDRVGAAAAGDLKLSTKEQRVDSTQIVSNIFTRGRRDLFRKTLVHFFEWLEKEHPGRMAQLREATRSWYEETKKTGWFGKVDKEMAHAETVALAERLYEVILTFGEDDAVTAAEPYQLVARLFAEHCEVKSGNDQSGGGAVEIALRKKADHPGRSLQSPYDPDAGFGHKGSGYSAHIAETCRNEDTEIITDYEVLSAGETDRGQDAAVIERLAEAGVKPEVLYEDGGYPTGEGMIEAAKAGTEIVAPMTGGALPENAVGRERFEFDVVTGECTRCPAGHAPTRHDMRSTHHGKPRAMHAYFDGETCRGCELQPRCVARPPNNGKSGAFHLEVGANLIARDRALASQRDAAWWNRYKIRAGIEATMSELKRRHGIGKLRVRRLPRVRMAVGFKIVACNVKRWLRAAAAAAVRASALSQAAVDIVANACIALQRFSRRLFVSRQNRRAITAN